ncbi:unnamed protein product [Notodromas monacha]|uniref:PBZ-type domain-containing protein n=1 Tax=Notodromas monacha TaxID=399045 RepID=A0A7R9BSF6_9CRUS|nr:unnamed protein product [Notodromas monacha]CAG0919803.1 unnamed protein product [Notodromas monacha]
MDDLQTSFDVVIVGTGFSESIAAAACSRIGKQVLHLDRNTYYGDSWATFNWASLQEWLQVVTRKEEIVRQDHPENDDVLKVSFRPIFHHVEQEYFIPHDIEVECGGDNADRPEDDVRADANPEGDVPVAEAANHSAAPRTTAWSKRRIEEQGRRFNVELAPKVVYSSGSLVEMLIHSNVSRYLEFKCITRILTKKDGDLVVVPCSRADVFASRGVSVIEKRMLMKLMHFVSEAQKNPDYRREFEGKSFIDFLRSHSLTDNLLHFVIHSIAMVDPECPAEQGISSVQKFINSLGRFGNSPFLWPMYGSGEIPQAFSRLCAVFGGTYFLQRAVEGIELSKDENHVVQAVISRDTRIECQKVILCSSYVPCKWRSRGVKRSVSRLVLLTDRSIKTSVTPEVTLMRIPGSGTRASVTLLELGPGSNATPEGLYIVHLTCLLAEDPKEDMKSIVEEFFVYNGEVVDDRRSNCPRILWSLHFAVDDFTFPLTENANIFVLPGPGDSYDFEEHAVKAKEIFQRMFPNEEFLPRAPDPDEIVIGGDDAPPVVTNTDDLADQEQAITPNDLEAAMEEHEEEMSIYASLGMLKDAAVAQRNIGEVNALMDKHDENISCQRKYLQMTMDLNDSVEIQRAHTMLGQAYIDRVSYIFEKRLEHRLAVDEDLREALVALMESRDDVKTIVKKGAALSSNETSIMLCRANVNLGIVHLFKGEFSCRIPVSKSFRSSLIAELQKAEEYFREAVKIAATNMLPSDHIRALMNMVDLEYRAKRYEAALKYAEEVASLDTKLELAEVYCHWLPKLNLNLERCKEAKHHFIKYSLHALRANKLNDSAKIEMAKSLTTLKRICKNSKELKMNGCNRAKVYEQLGDDCCEMNTFEIALIYYQKALKLLVEGGASSKALAPLYQSLAQTCCDLRNYNEGIDYYTKELECYEPEEFKNRADTLLSMAEAEEKARKAVSIVRQRYERAIGDARKAGDSFILKVMLEKLVEFLQFNGLSVESEERLDEIKQIPASSTDYDEENREAESDSETLESLEDMLKKYEALYPVNKPRQETRVRKTPQASTNDRGETPLHQAAITNDALSARVLATKPSIVNARDYSNYTPLHDAAVRGHDEIVKILLENKAEVDARGGVYNGTALMEAASDGRESTVELLLAHGADPCLRDASGNTPLEIFWIYNYDELHKKIPNMLANAMKAKGFNQVPVRPRRKPTIPEPPNFESIDRNCCREPDEVDLSPDEATQRIKSFSATQGSPDRSSPIVDDDVGFFTKKNRRNAVSQGLHECDEVSFSRRLHGTNLPLKRVRSPSKSTQQPAWKRTQLSVVPQSSAKASYQARIAVGVVSPRLNSPEPVPEGSPVTYEDNITEKSSGSSSISISGFSSSLTPRSCLLKDYVTIQILETNVPVKILPDETSRNLIERVAKLYENNYGRKIVIERFARHDNLVLPLDEVLSDFVKPEDMIVAVVKEVDMVSDVKVKLGVDVSGEDVARGLLNLSYQCLEPGVVNCLTEVLKSFSHLTTLNVSGNLLGDSAFEFIARGASVLQLKILDASCNNISPLGLKVLGQQLQADSKCFQALEEIILSFNPLLDAGADFLATLVSHCQNLRYLHCRDVDFTTSAFEPNRSLAKALKSRELFFVDFSGNLLCSNDNFFESLNVKRLNTLVINGIADSAGNEADVFCRGLANVLRSARILQVCSFCDNGLTDEVFCNVMESVDCVSGITFEASGNPIDQEGLRIMMKLGAGSVSLACSQVSCLFNKCSINVTDVEELATLLNEFLRCRVIFDRVSRDFVFRWDIVCSTLGIPIRFITNMDKHRPACKFGSLCYRKNEQHFKDFYHPSEKGKKIAAPKAEEKEKVQAEPKLVLMPHIEPAAHEISGSESDSSSGEDQPLSKRPRKDSGVLEVEDSMPEEQPKTEETDLDEDELKVSKDPKTAIKEMFLVEMTDDFSSFWDFLNETDHGSDVFKMAGLHLVGPFEVMAGKFEGTYSRKKLLRHWRFYYDPPEFQVTFLVEERTGWHMGYWRDDPGQKPAFVAENDALKDGTFKRSEANIFGAISLKLTKVAMELDPFKKPKIDSFLKAMKTYAEKRNIPLKTDFPKNPAKRRGSIADPFHGLGLVVPYNAKTELGYREIPETTRGLKKLFARAVTCDDEDRNAAMEPIDELVTNVQFANDEGDPGMGLELGLNAFTFGGNKLHGICKSVLGIAYMLLGRHEFKAILEFRMDVILNCHNSLNSLRHFLPVNLRRGEVPLIAVCRDISWSPNRRKTGSRLVHAWCIAPLYSTTDESCAPPGVRHVRKNVIGHPAAVPPEGA